MWSWGPRKALAGACLTALLGAACSRTGLQGGMAGEERSSGAGAGGRGPDAPPTGGADTDGGPRTGVPCDAGGHVLDQRTIIATGEQRVTALGLGSGGGLFATGSLADTVDLGAGPVVLEDPNFNFFLTQWDDGGEHVASALEPHAVGTDLNVNADGTVTALIYLTGDTDFGGGALGYGGSGDLALAKFTAEGAALFARRFGDGLPQTGVKLAAAPDGGSFVLGWFLGRVDLGGLTLEASADGETLLARFDADGELVWARSLGAVYGTALAAADGDLYVAGMLTTTVDFGGGSLEPSPKEPSDCCLPDLFLLALDADGDHVWSRQYRSVVVESMALDPTGHLLLTGMYSGEADFGGPALPPGVLTDRAPLFAARLRTDGSHVYSRALGARGAHDSHIAAGREGAAVIAASVLDGAELDCGSLPPLDDTPQSVASPDVLVLELDAAGGMRWARRYRGQYAQLAEAVAVAASGHVYVAVGFETGIEIEGAWLSGAEPDERAPDDVVILKLAP